MQFEMDETIFRQYLDMIADGEEGLITWERQLKNILVSTDGLSLLVFNANPFTNGHRYLAEIASKRSRSVLVLVIQGKPESGGKGNHENTGIELPFEDRLRLTRQCLSDLRNVTVLPSGPYIISRDDFPDGYLSEHLGSAPAHAALDSMVLCHVCTALGIRLAFAGDEPRDELSEIHLNAFRKECQKKGISLRVAERKRLGERYISSSLVRDALDKGNMEDVKALVPEPVADYLSGSFPSERRS